MATTKLFTAADLEQMQDDGYRYDLIEGVLHRMAAAGFEHGEIALEFARHIANFVVERRLGRVVASETGFFLASDPDTVLAPDVAFVRADRLPPKGERLSFLRIPPDLVVEVVSPSQSAPEIARKVETYLAAGVVLVWTVHARHQTVTASRAGQPPRVLQIGDVLDGEDVLPGFRLPVAAIFDQRP